MGNNMSKNPKIAFLPFVRSRGELNGVIPDADIAFAVDVSKDGSNHYFVYSNGQWTEESVCTAEQEANVKHGAEVFIHHADGRESIGVFTVVQGRSLVFEHQWPRRRTNYTPRFYDFERR